MTSEEKAVDSPVPETQAAPPGQSTVDSFRAQGQQPFQKWQSHKVVAAAKVADVKPFQDDGHLKVVLEPDHVLVDIGGEAPWVVIGKDFPPYQNNETLVGGYLVSYEDGYLSWSPAKPFEEGYTRGKSIGEQITDLREVACAKGTVDQGEYFRGMANGLILAESVALQCEPVYVDPPAEVEGPDDSQPDPEEPDRGSLSCLELLELAEDSAPPELKGSLTYILETLRKKQ